MLTKWRTRDAPFGRAAFNASRFTGGYARPEVYRQRDLPPTTIRGGMVGVMTSGPSVQAALAPADGRLRACRPVRRSDFRAIADTSAGGPTSRKSRARPARISPAVRVPGGRHGAGLARPGVRAGSA